jgi:hypothetical protein
VAKPKIPRKLFILGQELDIGSLEEDADWQTFVSAANAETEFTADLHQRLLTGAESELGGRQLEPLSPKRVAEFLTWIASSKNKELANRLKDRLATLGITRASPRQGRPKGRKADLRYLAYFDKVRDIFRQKGVFSRRKDLQIKYGPMWNARFLKELEAEGWTADEISVITTLKSPRAAAIQMAASAFKVTYEAVDRACRRRPKAAKK